MPISISTAAVQEKNKLSSNGVFVLLLELHYDEVNDPIYICWNTVDVIWNGHTYTAMPFELGDLNETKEAELPTVTLGVWDIGRVLTPHLHQFGGGVGTLAYIRVINTALSESTALREEVFSITEVAVDSQNKIQFTLGAENLMTYRSPKNRFLKAHCRYKVFKGAYCGYSGSESDCDRTFSRCKALGNQSRFGGFPGVGRTGLFE